MYSKVLLYVTGSGSIQYRQLSRDKKLTFRSSFSVIKVKDTAREGVRANGKE